MQTTPTQTTRPRGTTPRTIHAAPPTPWCANRAVVDDRLRTSRDARSVESSEQRRTEAVERLIATLEAGTPAEMRRPIRHTCEEEAASRLARLRTARAAYAVGTGVVRRVAPGVFVRQTKAA